MGQGYRASVEIFRRTRVRDVITFSYRRVISVLPSGAGDSVHSIRSFARGSCFLSFFGVLVSWFEGGFCPVLLPSVWCSLQMMIGSGFSGNVNMALLIFLAVLTCLFVLEVGVSLMFAYFDNVRAQQTFFKVPVIGYVFRFFARLSEKRRAREPIVVYDAENEVIQLVASKRQSWNLFTARHKNINLAERNYFIKVMAETLGFAVVHMKLDVIPGSFLEFALRLGLAFHRMEEDSQQNKKSLQAIAEGDLSQLADWSSQEQKRKELRDRQLKSRRKIAGQLDSFYKDMEEKLGATEAESDTKKKRSSFRDAEEENNRLMDLEGEVGLSDDELARMKTDLTDWEERENDQLFTAEDKAEQEKGGAEDAAPGREGDPWGLGGGGSASNVNEDEGQDGGEHLGCLEDFTVHMTEEEQQETMYLFDQDMMKCGIALSELYLALLKLQLKDSSTISQQFDAFKAQKKILNEEYFEMLTQRNRKLKVIREALETLLVSSGTELAKIGLSEENYRLKKEELLQLNKDITALSKKLLKYQENPDAYTGDSDEGEGEGGEGEGEKGGLEKEWIDEGQDEELRKLHEQDQEREQEKKEQEEIARETFFPSDPAEAAAWDSGSDIPEG